MVSTSITLETVNDAVAEIEKAYYNIPFENSGFQTENFVIAASITPERAFRNIGLRMMNKIAALRGAKYMRLEKQIDIDEMDEKLDSGVLNKYDVRREKLKRQQIQEELPYADKLINDALVELNILYRHFKTLPKYTREEFEAGEYQHYKLRLERDLVESAPQQSLTNMEEDMKTLLLFEREIKKLNGNDDERTNTP